MQGQQHCLLLLPSPPVPSTQASIAAAYNPSIKATILPLKDGLMGTQLTVAIACPSLHEQLQGPRSKIFGEVQSLLGQLYTLLSLACTELDVDVVSGGAGSVDARVILLDYDNGTSFSGEPKYVSGTGPIVDLPTFALTRRHWRTIFAVDGEEGQALLSNYMAIANSTTPALSCQLETVRGGVSLVEKSPDRTLVPGPTTLHNIVAVGGTFDHLHAGHKLLLTATALLLQPTSQGSASPSRLIVGITGDELLKNKKYAEYMKSWQQRQEDVVDFLVSILSFTCASLDESLQTSTVSEPTQNGRAIHTTLLANSLRIECVEIQDPFGPTITDESISALVVSAETRSGGKAVNDRRAEKGWSVLEIFEVDVLDAEQTDEGATKTENFASKISSTAIRKQQAENRSRPLDRM
ncbi:hypothetical protein BP6252_07199 [Coleophoma cylindrospora]|uniref:Cytidyltransferase-like domain-containing protein n=1 Tax=Coleophoma cylindrospora TaxID=1849047 RepID=A0A3D8RGX7_9HELO|nr:hypothetical protein BP6252_07199 [Coleophoma cylindrospora]